MNPIPYNQLFDIDGLKAAIKDAEKSSDDFGATTTESLKASQGAAAALKKELADINALMGGRTIKLTDESGQQAIVQYAQEVSRLSTQIKQQKQTIDQLTASINQNKQVISDAKAAQALYQAELVKGKLTQQETKNEIANTTLELRKMTIANREATAAQKELNSLPRVTQVSDSAAEVQAYAASKTAGGANVAASGSAALIAAFNQDLKEGKISATEYKEAIDRINLSQAEFAVQAAKSDVAIEAEIGLIANLNKELALLKLEKINIVDPTQLARQNALIQETEAEIVRLNNVGKVGFDGMGNAVKETTEKTGKFEAAISRATNISNIGARAVTQLTRQLIGLGVGFLSFAIGAKAVDMLIEWVKNLDYFTGRLDEAKQKLIAMQAALASGEYTKAVSSIAELTENIKLAKDGFLSKTEVLHEYNNTLGSSIGYTDDLDKAEANIVKHGEAFIKMTQLKAAAQLALQASTKATYEAQQLTERPTDSFTSIFDGLPVQNNSASDVKASQANLKASRKARQDDQVKETQKTADLQLKIFKDLQLQAAKIAKDNKIDFFDGTQDEKLKKSLKGAKDGFQVLEEQINKTLLKLQDSIVKDYTQNQGRQTEQTLKLANAYEYLVAKLNEYKKAQADAINETNRQNQIKQYGVVYPGVKTPNGPPNLSQKEQNSLTIADNNNAISGNDLQLNAIVEKYNEENEAIIDLYKKRAISKEEMDKRITASERFEAGEQYQINFNTINKQLENAKLTYGQDSKQYSELLKQKSNLTKAYYDGNFKWLEEELAKEKKKLEDAYNSIFSNVDKAAGVVGDATGSKGLGNALTDVSHGIKALSLSQQPGEQSITDAEKFQGAAQLGIDATQAYTDFAIEASKQRQAALEQERQYEIQGAGNNAEAKQRIELEYNKKIKAEKQKQAKAQKAASAIEVILNTAIAVSKTLAEGGVWGIPLAIVVGALGAIELGIVLATPLPQFAKGREDGPATFAEVNERGPEALVKGDRVRFANKGKRGMTYLERGEKVFTADKTSEMINRQLVYQADAAENVSQSRMIYDRYISSTTNRDNIDYDRIGSAMSDAVSKMPYDQNIFDERGHARYRRTANTRIKSVRDRNTL